MRLHEKLREHALKSMRASTPALPVKSFREVRAGSRASRAETCRLAGRIRRFAGPASGSDELGRSSTTYLGIAFALVRDLQC